MDNITKEQLWELWQSGELIDYITDSIIELVSELPLESILSKEELIEKVNDEYEWDELYDRDIIESEVIEKIQQNNTPVEIFGGDVIIQMVEDDYRYGIEQDYYEAILGSMSPMEFFGEEVVLNEVRDKYYPEDVFDMESWIEDNKERLKDEIEKD